MNDIHKPKEQLVNELAETRQRIAELEALEIEYKQEDEMRIQLLAIVNSSNDAIVGTTMDGTITIWNPGAERLYGYPAEEAIGRSVLMLVSPYYPENLPGLIEQVSRGEKVEHYETKRVTKDGTEVDVSLTVSPIVDASDRIIGVSTIAHDITEHKDAESEMQRLNLVLRAMQGVNQLIIKEKGRDQLLKGICDSLVETRGYYNAWVALLDESKKLITAAEAGIGEAFLQMVEQLDRGDLTSCCETALMEPGAFVTGDPASTCTNCPLVEGYAGRGAISARLEYRGKVYGMLSASVPGRFTTGTEERSLFEEVAGNIAFALHSIELEEQHKLSQKQLTESEKRYRDLFGSAGEAIFVINLEGDIIEANRAAVALFGYSFEELVRMNVKQLLGSYSLDFVRSQLKQRKGRTYRYECQAVKKDGVEAVVQTAVREITVGGKSQGFHFIARDTTEEKQMRDNMRFYINQVTWSQESERKRIARELHDDTIQELILLARELDELAATFKGLTEDEKQRVNELWHQTNAITEGVRRLSQDLRPPTIDRLGLLSALKWLARRTKEHSGIDVDVSSQGDQRRAGPDSELLLFRIAQEALSNIWRHSQATSTQIKVEFREDLIRISIIDNGRGFRVPDAMGSLAEAGKLGLAGMQERARLLGGSVTLKSVPGKGTVVTVEAPV
ncbi:PAS domain S-box protein [Chloroflexota bacterium]